MTNEQLCRLALAAIDDADSRVVLADAIEESGGLKPWVDRTAAWLTEEWHFGRMKGRASGDLEAHLVAAVLLFGEFQQHAWR